MPVPRIFSYNSIWFRIFLVVRTRLPADKWRLQINAKKKTANLENENIGLEIINEKCVEGRAGGCMVTLGGGLRFYARGCVQKQKSRTLPHARVWRSDQEPDSVTIEKRPAETEAQCSCWYFEHGIKRIFTKLGRFSYSFDEIRLKMSLETNVHRFGSPFQAVIYTVPTQKSSPKRGLLRLSVHFCRFFGPDIKLFATTRNKEDFNKKKTQRSWNALIAPFYEILYLKYNID